MPISPISWCFCFSFQALQVNTPLPLLPPPGTDANFPSSRIAGQRSELCLCVAVLPVHTVQHSTAQCVCLFCTLMPAPSKLFSPFGLHGHGHGGIRGFAVARDAAADSGVLVLDRKLNLRITKKGLRPSPDAGCCCVVKEDSF